MSDEQDGREEDRQRRLTRIRALVHAEPALRDPHGTSARPDGVTRIGGPTGGSLERLCRAAARSLPASGVGLSVMTADGTQGAVAFSDPVSAIVEELQFTFGEGPCLDAVASGRPVLSGDLEAAIPHWPAYAPTAYGHGVRAVFAFPLQIGAMRLGALDVYRTRRGPLSRPVLQEAVGFAEVALVTLLDAQAEAPPDEAADILDDGVSARAELYQAQGMLTVQLGIGLAEAMIRLRAYAYSHDRPLIDVARAVLSRELTLDADRDHHRFGPGGTPRNSTDDDA